MGSHTLLILADLIRTWRSSIAGHALFVGSRPRYLSHLSRVALGVGVGPLPNIPLPLRCNTRVCPPPSGLSRYGPEAAHDSDYVEDCYGLVQATIQRELDDLFPVMIIPPPPRCPEPDRTHIYRTGPEGAAVALPWPLTPAPIATTYVCLGEAPRHFVHPRL